MNKSSFTVSIYGFSCIYLWRFIRFEEFKLAVWKENCGSNSVSNGKIERNSIEWVLRYERKHLWGVGADYWNSDCELS
jgi:hypothetical protein